MNLSPSQLLKAPGDIASGILLELRSHPGNAAWDARAIAVILFSLVLVVAFYYWGRPGNLDPEFTAWLGSQIGLSTRDEYFPLLPYGWWAAMSVLLRLLLPCLFIWWVLRDRLCHYGFTLRINRAHLAAYSLFLFGMLPIVYAVSLTESFQQTYPFYRYAHLNAQHFLYFELFYGIQFFCLEAFFRGFMIFALFKRFGYYALLFMVIPYCMIHLGKPPAEAFAAIVAGIALGYLALRSGSWVYGALLHWAVAISMDIMAILQKGGFAG